MRKFILFIAVLLIVSPLFNGTTVQAAASSWLNESEINKGVISVDYDVKATVKTKLLIVKGQDKYSYNLSSGKQAESFPLQLGNGEYTVSVLEQVSGDKYQVVNKDTVTLKLSDSKMVYLNSVQNVKWNDSDQAVHKAKELTKNLNSDADKVKVIYNYVISNIKYDDNLAANVSTDYLPEIDHTLSSKKDICYGYSALFAAMLRSVDIPTKLVMGTSNYVKSYHSWNEVYLNNKWVIVDTTVDAGLKDSKTAFTMIKEASKYSVSKTY
ncbi:transglutaminase-like domain-containing protein [Paenibacillus segetis]|uniref:Transglutaminase-like domain-containing protein n=1 Tax=Paenibacillus segetis TaxID=1325360 RepID=A0ABQ1Y8F3_9BACL|nr:transglutaminase-like domain-containing protein [Paenibacillus segetis]GGH16348.1 hypothetical protein GCM10008013_11080 [Paenibacillus segetis]